MKNVRKRRFRKTKTKKVRNKWGHGWSQYQRTGIHGNWLTAEDVWRS